MSRFGVYRCRVFTSSKHTNIVLLLISSKKSSCNRTAAKICYPHVGLVILWSLNLKYRLFGKFSLLSNLDYILIYRNFSYSNLLLKIRQNKTNNL